MDQGLVTVYVGGHSYQLPLGQVREAFDLDHLTPVPSAPPALAGLVNLRGEVVPAVNLGILLGRPGRPLRPGDVLLVVEAEQQRLALAVDRVVFSAGSSVGGTGRVAATSGEAPTTPPAEGKAGEAFPLIDARTLLGLLARAVSEAGAQSRLRLMPGA